MTQGLIVPKLLMSVPILAAATPAVAETYQADGFARNIWSTVSFLDQSSRLALKQSGSKRLREFARGEAAEQTAAANALAAWLDSTDGGKAPAPPENPPPARSVVSMPFRAAAAMSSGMADAIDGTQTGRSVAVDPEPRRPTILRTISVQSFSENLDRLKGASGRAFDDLYRASQVDALLQLSTLYASYIQHGDDPGLRALAVRELPKLNTRLALIKSLR